MNWSLLVMFFVALTIQFFSMILKWALLENRELVSIKS